ncbi:MAG: YigZ family protein [Chlorobi bacterium]|nr:MAG: IMPACT family member YigZ [Chlorobi bacterium OLB7]MBK8912235.1 YigZ family protein [Chlorobiota bacterium]MBX7215952.1 YigZ family protein [Candidatus Kapabacteria bacterium]
MALMKPFKSIVARVRSETKVRGSRFIGTAIPVAGRDDIDRELAAIRKEFWDATHNCYAWRLAPDGLQYRFSDDGEPAGSAGKPILFVMQQRELVNTLVVVTRYFGGVKLGVGGLVRAYGDATAEALNATEIITTYPSDRFRVFTPYEDMKAIRPLVERYALKFEEEFLDVVNYTISVRSDQAEEFQALVTESSQGRAGTVKIE